MINKYEIGQDTLDGANLKQVLKQQRNKDVWTNTPYDINRNMPNQ